MAGPKDSEGELVTIRKLLVLALLNGGMTQAQIGAALGMHRTQVGRMFPAGALDSLKKRSDKTKQLKAEGDDE